MDFELPTERRLESNTSIDDRDTGLRNLMEIEDRIHARMHRIAKEVGGRYIPPSVPEIVQKVNTTLDLNPNIFYSVDQNETIWTPGGKKGVGSKNTEAYNRSGNFGFILVNTTEPKEGEEETVRLYRGCLFNPQVPQIASLARIEGITVNNIYNYIDDKESMDDIIAKVKDNGTKRYLQSSLAASRKMAEENSTTEKEEIRRMHTQFTSGAIELDLWVSTAYRPSDVYRQPSLGNVYGDFLSEEGIRSVLILDVPKSKVEDYHSEAGILAEIKPEYIRAIVPISGDVVKTVKKAETYFNYPTSRKMADWR